jgi:hypothetical protein
MRRAKFSPNMGYVLKRLRFEDGNDEERKVRRWEMWSKELQQASPFPAPSLIILN